MDAIKWHFNTTVSENILYGYFYTIFYLIKIGSLWHWISGCFPNWELVYYYFTKWKNNDVIVQAHELVPDKICRGAGKYESPSFACIDNQSIKTTRLGGEWRGFDGGKMIKDRKHHIVTDLMGLLLAAVVYTANVDDSKGTTDVIA